MPVAIAPSLAGLVGDRSHFDWQPAPIDRCNFDLHTASEPNGSEKEKKV